MSWHDHCTGYTIIGKVNRYAFVDEFGGWNRVKYGSNFDDIYWIVSDKTLNEKQTKVILNKMTMREGIDTLEDQKYKIRFGKAVMWFRVSW